MDALRARETLSNHHAFDCWHEAMSAFCNVAPTDTQTASYIRTPEPPSSLNYKQQPIDGHMNSYMFDGFMTLDVRSGPQRIYRNFEKILSGGDDAFAFMSVDQATWGFGSTLGNVESSVDSGDILAVDFSKPAFADCSRLNTQVLFLPRAILNDRLPDIENAHLSILHRQHPLTRFVSRHIQSLHEEAAHMTIQDSKSLLEPTVALLTAALEATPDNLDRAETMIDRNYLLEIRQLIDHNLFDPQLNATFIAKQLGLSRSKLYRLTEPLGSLKNFINQRRMRYAFRLLASGHSRTSILQLSEQLGFGSESSFRRNFKSIFGMTPTDVRQLGRRAYQFYYADKSNVSQTPTLASGEMLHHQWMTNIFSR
ncbi:Transcriptional activator FeaR [BD1-7 clade bacterium]|uniref:Transcriptional activator FeaR n=1 Tax=BD1-7 clade bacterium TaxID=2029982 RepID=A0A5S9P8I6_9GAMM|nr:Transcriptional activator FeaR [BD1-7 clade bacterium]CAA0099585.1 Transcriptional activator FeaR [BD1-7 clade bacterium]